MILVIVEIFVSVYCFSILALMACVACQYGVPWWISDDGMGVWATMGFLILSGIKTIPFVLCMLDPLN